jgi:hypothetical protein
MSRSGQHVATMPYWSERIPSFQSLFRKHFDLLETRKAEKHSVAQSDLASDYAYDLDQQPGIEQTSTFQAWGGRRGQDHDHAVNLGILYQDNATRKRWVLKSDSTKTLAQIDAVFVTVVPNGGRVHPGGKPLLFACLRIQPNQPQVFTTIGLLRGLTNEK